MRCEEKAKELVNDGITPATRIQTTLSSERRRSIAPERESSNRGARAGGSAVKVTGVWHSTGGNGTRGRCLDRRDDHQTRPAMTVAAATAALRSRGSWTNTLRREDEAGTGDDVKNSGWGSHANRLRIAPCTSKEFASIDTSSSLATNVRGGSATIAQEPVKQDASCFVPYSKDIKEGGEGGHGHNSQSSDGTHGASAVAVAAAAAASTMAFRQTWQDCEGDAHAVSVIRLAENAVTSRATGGTTSVLVPPSNNAQSAFERDALIGQRTLCRPSESKIAREELLVRSGGQSGHRRMLLQQRSYSDDSMSLMSDLSMSEFSKSDLSFDVKSDHSIGMVLARQNHRLQDEALALAAAAATEGLVASARSSP